VPQKPQCVVLRQTVILLRKSENLLGQLSPPSFNRHDGAIDPCLRHVARAGFWMPCRTSPRSVSLWPQKAPHDGGPCIGIAHEIGQCAEH
jgi:hypothetical protein